MSDSKMTIRQTMNERQFRDLYKAGYSISEIAKIMELHESTVRIIVRDLDVI